MIDNKDKKIKDLEDENEKLKRELKKVKEEFEDIKKEFEEFKSKHALTVSNLRKTLKIKADSSKTAKPIGAPNGHKGYARHIPERIDKIEELNIKRCPHCNTKLGETQEIRSRHITDIKLTSKVKQALPHARFGLNLMLLVMYLRLGLRLPCNKTCEYFMDMFSLKISEGEIIGILRQLVVAFGDYYTYLEKIVLLARIKHSDTTSWRINGKNYTAWVFIACGAVLYKIRKSTCHKAGLSFLRKQNGNVLVVDRLSAMRLLAKKAGFLLQLCWSHILQDSKQLAENFGAEGKYNS